MEGTIVPQKTPFYKKKAIMIPVVMALLAIVVTAGVILSEKTQVNVTVNEPLSVISDPVININAYPGATYPESIIINNAASINENAQIAWVQNDNVNGVDYSTTLPVSVVLPNGDTEVDFNVSIAGGSPVGNFSGNVTVTRTN